MKVSEEKRHKQDPGSFYKHAHTQGHAHTHSVTPQYTHVWLGRLLQPCTHPRPQVYLDFHATSSPTPLYPSRPCRADSTHGDVVVSREDLTTRGRTALWEPFWVPGCNNSNPGIAQQVFHALSYVDLSSEQGLLHRF